MEAVWDHVVKINKCFKLDRKTEYLVTAGAGTTVDNPVEADMYAMFNNVQMQLLWLPMEYVLFMTMTPPHAPGPRQV